MEGRMYESQPQHLLDLQDSSGFSADPKSWLSGDDLSRTFSSLSAAAAASSATGGVDPVLFNDLVAMVPLVQSLIDQKSKSSFTRRGSVIYTKTPSRDSVYRKTAGRPATLPTKKPRDQGDRNAANSQDTEDLSVSSRTLLSEKDREELMALRDQVEGLKRQLSEKDELLESAELVKNEMASVQTKYEELKSEAAEKDSLLKSTQLQLSDAKVKLADKQAAFEKLQWEAMTSSKKVERLQEDLDKVQGDISSFMLLIEGLTRNDSAISAGDYEDDFLYRIDQNHEIDDEMDIQELEDARAAYITAVAAAKELRNDESISAAARARFHLQSLVSQQS
ncbi:protein MICROTUBULE BINDING PROTEIN 2C-like [Salvia divinorum]|uniref:Protein MICROTUBULE BINDING PROTEIN 2C-like n=1 Tax=Salvia divinorum TaxID=28513 RepID=A0ABD1FIL9_SALDI